jgi:hypothetical protein
VERRERDHTRGARRVGEKGQLAEDLGGADRADRRAGDPALGDPGAHDVQGIPFAARLEDQGARVEPALLEERGELGPVQGRKAAKRGDRRQRFRCLGCLAGLVHVTRGVLDTPTVL